MKKILCVLMLALILVLLAGCTESEITCGVNPQNQAFLKYDFQLDLSELNPEEQESVRLWLWDMAYRMQEQQGFDVQTNADTQESQVYLRALLARPGKNPAEAAELLNGMLTDETLSPFTAAAADCLKQDALNGYRVQVRLEPDRILATAGTEQMPRVLREKIRGWLDKASIGLTLTLPATDLPEGETAQITDGFAEKHLEIPVTENGELTLSTLVYRDDGNTNQVWWGGKSREAGHIQDLAETVGREEAELHRLSVVFLIVAAVLLVLAVGFFVWGTIRKRKIR